MSRNDGLSSAAVLLLLVTGAALLQDAAPPLAWGQVKPPFLLSLAAYYGLRRPLGLAALACVWVGLLLDGLGSVPSAGGALAVLLWFLVLCAVWARRQMSESVVACMVLAAGAAVVLSLSQAFWRWRAGDASADFLMALVRAGLQGLLAFPACALTVAVADALDRFASNLPTETHADGFDWSGSRR